ncbi:MAG TPA: tetratricopeptide repeat protein [Bacteroidia bacterium]|nr:tetratricopeptide repeat protein [Bacteroidia bacterium]
MKLQKIFSLFLVALPLMVFSQRSNDHQLADQYFYKGEFDKASELYEKLYDKNPLHPGLYNNYLRCLLEMKQTDKAEKIVKKQIKKVPGNPVLLIDLGQVYFRRNDFDGAKKQYESAIKMLPPDQGMIVNTANSFLMIQETDYALQTYLGGRKLMSGMYAFNFELAEIYFRKQDYAHMVDEYMNALEENGGFLQNVQNILQSRLGFDTDNNISETVRTAVLRRIQKSPEESVFADLLIWLLIQQKDFESAFIQAKAVDKRLKESGSRLISLGQLAVSNQDYDAGIKCFQYIIEKGHGNFYYITARMEMLNARSKKVTESGRYENADLLNLEKDYHIAVEELGKSGATAPLLRGLAHLLTFYLNKTDDAIKLLEEAIALPDIKPNYQAECKLELGDALLFSGDLWESGLFYSQVDKAFKYDELGKEAKFRNAKLDFYRGEFQWARAQLDILKSSTTQLIANDAMSLSLVISDNTAFDSTTDALTMFANAGLFNFRNLKQEALLTLDTFLQKFPAHTLYDDVLFKKAEVLFSLRRYIEADSLYGKVVSGFPTGVLSDDAQFRRAHVHEKFLSDNAGAMQLYEELLKNYPGSTFVVEARKRYRLLRGDKVN